MAGSSSEPLDGNYRPINAIVVPGGGLVVPQGGAIGGTDSVSGQSYAPTIIRLEDGVSANLATVSQFHNADHQNPGTTAYGILTGGVAQLLTADGFIDRQRETGVDQVSGLGIVMGSQMFAQLFSTSVPTTGTIAQGAASATITPASMTGIQVGAVVTLDVSPNVETAVVTALPSASTATIVPTNGAPTAPSFKFAHTPSYQVTGFMYNQERDASGENSGASGKGTAVAAEYEYTSGGPALANGTPSQLQYDREVAALGKVAVNAGAGYAITSTTAGNTSLTLTTPGNGATLTPGQWIRLSGSGTNEYVRVADSYTISTAPASIPLTSPVVNSSQTVATWDAFGANGPGQNPVLWTGEGFEGVLLNDRANAGFARALQGNTAGEAAMTVGGLQTTQVTPTSLTVIKASPGRLARVLCSTANATNAILIYDNASAASGTVIGAIPTTATIGQIFDLQMPAANGITIAATASAGTITVSWS